MYSKSLAADPRPDLKADHELWGQILVQAIRYCVKRPDCFQLPGNLHGLRCGGARLLRRPNGHLKLVPGEWRTNEWQRILAKYLDPYKEHVKAIFELVRQAEREKREQESLEQATLFGELRTQNTSEQIKRAEGMGWRYGSGNGY